jgi:hypothetical protein
MGKFLPYVVSTIALGLLLTTPTGARKESKSWPIAPVELGEGPIDEVAQLERIRVALKDHLRMDNEDTRFIIDRNDMGVFRMMRNVGVVHYISDADSDDTKIGTGTLLNFHLGHCSCRQMVLPIVQLTGR